MLQKLIDFKNVLILNIKKKYFLKIYELESLQQAQGLSGDTPYKIWWLYCLVYSCRLKNLTGCDYFAKFIRSKLSICYA